ncbi:hypothetical protein Tco_0474335 [Tanacetum coccineum]
MTTTNQGLSFAEIEQIVAQRVANAIETIAIYETKTHVAHDLINQVERQEDKMAENASNKRKWEGNHGGSSSQNKGHNMIRAHVAGPNNKKVYAGNLPYYNKCKFHHTGRCNAKCGTTSGLDTTRAIAQNGRTICRGTILTSWHITLMHRERPPSYLAEFNSELS